MSVLDKFAIVIIIITIFYYKSSRLTMERLQGHFIITYYNTDLNYV